MAVQGDTLVVSALKKADTGNRIVVRLFEEAGEHPDTRIRFLDQDRGFQNVNLLEEPSSHDMGTVLRVHPFEIDTVELGSLSR